MESMVTGVCHCSGQVNGRKTRYGDIAQGLHEMNFTIQGLEHSSLCHGCLNYVLRRGFCHPGVEVSSTKQVPSHVSDTYRVLSDWIQSPISFTSRSIPIANKQAGVFNFHWAIESYHLGLSLRTMPSSCIAVGACHPFGSVAIALWIPFLNFDLFHSPPLFEPFDKLFRNFSIGGP